jgi:hypothetical protein
MSGPFHLHRFDLVSSLDIFFGGNEMIGTLRLHSCCLLFTNFELTVTQFIYCLVLDTKIEECANGSSEKIVFMLQGRKLVQVDQT